MEKRLQEILKRKKEIRAKFEANISGEVTLTEDETAELEKELEELNQEEENMVDDADTEAKRSIAKEGSVVAKRRFKPGEDVGEEEEERKLTVVEKRQRGKNLKEQRSITVGSSEIILAKHTGEGLNKTFNEVSTLIDLVKITPLKGGESFERGYVKGYGEGGSKTEGGDYKDVETTFDYATISKQEVTAYQEQPKAIKKLADASYSEEVINGIGIALKKKMSKSILTGTGTTGEFQGIFTNPEKFAINKNTDIAISEIDEDTLDEIVYTYGGEEDVQNDAALILNKLDLKAFKKVRYPDGKKVYEIINKGNTGTIDGIPFVINSACKAISDSNTASDDYCMAYGSLNNYEVAVFSDVEVQESNDFKFKSGQIAHRGEGFFGGNVVAKNGFVRVKKAAAANTEETA